MTLAVDLRADDPLHRQVATTIASSIHRGELGPGDRLPSERGLAERLGVSRVTVRRALHELAMAGLVESQQGRGSFVTAPPIGEDRNELLSFTELGAERGLVASAEVLEARTVPATVEEAERFGIAPGADVFTLERLRSLNGLAVSLDRARVPLERAPHLPTVDFASASLYQELARAGLTPVSADYTVRAAPADTRRASLLGVAVDSPLLLTTTTGFAADGRVVELGEMAYRADRYRFQATLVRGPRAQAQSR